MKDLQRQLRIGFILVPGGLLLQLAATVLLARCMGPTAWGVFSVLQTIMLICNNATELGVGTAVTKLVAEGKKPAGHYVGLALPPVLLLAFIAAILQGIILNLWYPPSLVGLASILSGLNILMFGSSMVLSCAVRGLGHINQWQLGFFGQKVVLLVIAAGVIYPTYHGSAIDIEQPGTPARVLAWSMGAWTIANLATLAYFAFKLWPSHWRGKMTWNRDDLRSLSAEALPVGGVTILNQLAGSVDTFLLAAMAGERIVGLFNVAQRLINPARTVLNGTISTPTFPGLCSIIQRDHDEFARRSSQLLLVNWIAGLVIATSGFVLAPLLPAVFGREYQESVVVFQITVWALPPTFVVLQFRFIYVAANRSSRFASLSLAYLLIKALLLGVLVSSYGMTGACSGTVLAELVTMAVICFDAAACVGVRLPSMGVLLSALTTLPVMLAATKLEAMHPITLIVLGVYVLLCGVGLRRTIRGARVSADRVTAVTVVASE